MVPDALALSVRLPLAVVRLEPELNDMPFAVVMLMALLPLKLVAPVNVRLVAAVLFSVAVMLLSNVLAPLSPNVMPAPDDVFEMLIVE